MSAFVDLLILGSGFGGSLLATIARQQGYSVALVDRAAHPRFAIGESSTPLADQTLAELARQYDLPELLPLCQYGSWPRMSGGLTCGAKQGFSYFGHQRRQPFNTNDQLLVIARRTRELADTHWLRSDVDQFLFQLAQSREARTYEKADYILRQTPTGWQCSGTAGVGDFDLTAPFVVDATARAGEVMRVVKVEDETHSLHTCSHGIYAHFENLRPVAAVLQDLSVEQSRHPFACDDAAVHHVLDGGWMWQLRFDDDTVSVGLMTPQEPDRPQLQWEQTIDDHRFLSQQFADARIVRPAHELIVTGRVQHLQARAAGPTWAALPAAAGFIDPLHSTGIAHTLFAVRRLAALWQPSAGLSGLQRWQAMKGQTFIWQRYSDVLLDELRHIDLLVAGCYQSLPSFRLWSAWCMIYFAAVTTAESATGRKQLDGSDCFEPSFLRAADSPLRQMIFEARRWLDECVQAGSTVDACRLFERRLAAALRPWNECGLLDPDRRGMYDTTACPSVDE
ncbi:MAG: tryptophan 7-halogenase [Planctomycetaceae bacterium]|nr:tryptophan 7-halogenase [Planctomycetaceae bacterium]